MNTVGRIFIAIIVLAFALNLTSCMTEQSCFDLDIEIRKLELRIFKIQNELVETDMFELDDLLLERRELINKQNKYCK